MKTCQWIGFICGLLLASTGCNLFSYALYTTANVMGDPDSLYFAKQRAGIGTFPFEAPAPPPPTAPDLQISYGDESRDGVVCFAHSNERLHYQQAVARIDEILKTTSGPMQLEIRIGKRDLDWEPQFKSALKELKEFDRLRISWKQATSAAPRR